MLNETEAAASFHGLCHFFGRLSKASRAGMKAALRGCPKCHFPMLEGLAHTISTHGRTERCMFPILPGRHTSRCRPSAAACASWNRTALFCAKRTRLTGAKAEAAFARVLSQQKLNMEQQFLQMGNQYAAVRAGSTIRWSMR